MIKAVLLLIVPAFLWRSLRALERRSLYFPDRVMIANPQVYRLSFEDLTLTTQDGLKILGWFIPAPVGKTGSTLLLCHGNAGNISHRMDKALKFHEMGLGVIADKIIPRSGFSSPFEKGGRGGIWPWVGIPPHLPFSKGGVCEQAPRCRKVWLRLSRVMV